MLVVVDANVVISALITRGKPFRIFKLNGIEKMLEFIAPNQLYTEIENNLEKILASSRLEKEEFIEALNIIRSQIDVIQYEAFKDKKEEANSLAPHIEDAEYIALALKFDAKIITGDKALTKALPSHTLSPSSAYAILTGP